jgi:hypothetical protein
MAKQTKESSIADSLSARALRAKSLERDLNKIARERQSLDTREGKLREKLAALESGVEPAAPKRKRRKAADSRPAREGSLKAVILGILPVGEPMTKVAVMEAIVAGGYESKSDKFDVVAGQALKSLIDDGKVSRPGRGQYVRVEAPVEATEETSAPEGE